MTSRQQTLHFDPKTPNVVKYNLKALKIVKYRCMLARLISNHQNYSLDRMMIHVFQQPPSREGLLLKSFILNDAHPETGKTPNLSLETGKLLLFLM